MKKIIGILCCLFIFSQSVMAQDAFDDKKIINVVFLGGSITAGAGASTPDKNWVNQVTKFMKDKYSDKVINSFNMGVGGTGSDFGLLRLKRDVISRNPDYVFIEFSVNDANLSDLECERYMEGIVRNLQGMSNPPIINFVYTVTKKFNSKITANQKIADYYDIPTINLFDYVKKMMDKGELTSDKMWVDGTHPTDFGYKLYSDFIIDKLKNETSSYIRPFTKQTEKYLDDCYMFCAEFIPAGESDYDNNWTLSGATLETSVPNSKLIFKFKGPVLAIQNRISPNGGKFKITIDGANEQIIDTFYNSNNQLVMWYKKTDLENKEHTAEITVLQDKNTASIGNRVAFDSFIVATVVDEPTLPPEEEKFEVTFDETTQSVSIDGITPKRVSGENISLLLLNPNYTLEQSKTDKKAVQKIDETLSKKGGKYKFYFELSSDAILKSGIYKLYIKYESSVEPLVTEFYFTSLQDITNALLEIKNIFFQEQTPSQSQISDVCIKNQELLKFSFPPYEKIDKHLFFNKVYLNVRENPSYLASDLNLRELVQSLSVLESFNQGKLELVVDNNNKFLYPDYMKLTEISQDGYSAFELYNTSINPNGKTDVLNSLCKKNFNSILELKNEFANNAVIQGLKNNIKSGYGYVKDILVKNRVLVNLDLNEYMLLQDTSAVDIAIMKGDFNTIAQLQTLIDTSLKSNSGDISTGNGSTNGSPSVGGGFTAGSNDLEIKKGFSDIDSVQWAKNSIEKLAEKGVINGISSDTYAPYDSVKKEQFVKMIMLSGGYTCEINENEFSDVELSQWYAPYVTTAKKYNIVNGINENLFGIGTEITRQDVAVIIYRMLKSANFQINNSVKMVFSDDSQIAPYAREAVYALNNSEIILGLPNGNFEPLSICNRAQAAVIIDRMITLVASAK